MALPWRARPTGSASQWQQWKAEPAPRVSAPSSAAMETPPECAQGQGELATPQTGLERTQGGF